MSTKRFKCCLVSYSVFIFEIETLLNTTFSTVLICGDLPPVPVWLHTVSWGFGFQWKRTLCRGLDRLWAASFFSRCHSHLKSFSPIWRGRYPEGACPTMTSHWPGPNQNRPPPPRFQSLSFTLVKMAVTPGIVLNQKGWCHLTLSLMTGILMSPAILSLL